MTKRGLKDRATHALRYWLLRRLPTCRQTAEFASLSLERSLTPAERAKVRLHLWVCVWCVRYLEQLRLMRDALRARATRVPDGDDPTSPSLSAESRERIKRALGQRPN